MHFSMHDAAARINSMEAIGIIPPDIRVYQLSYGGVAEMHELSEAAAKSSVEEMAAFFRSIGFEVKLIVPDMETMHELREVTALSKAVNKNLLEFRNPVDLYAPPPDLGNLHRLAQYYAVGAFAFMEGFEAHKDEKDAFSKKLATVAVSAIYGPSALPKQGRSWACVSLADARGGVVWASYRNSPVSLNENFRDQENTKRLVRGLFSRFPN